MKAKLYMVKCLTNLHVGNGDVNFNIIDNEVEKDPVTGYPTIHASGVKGALRSHFKGLGIDTAQMDAIFGKANTSDDVLCAGRVKFFSANMLAIPMRSSRGNRAYSLVTTDTALTQLQALMEAICGRTPEIKESRVPVQVEGIDCDVQKTIFTEALTVMREQDFRTTSLPVLARNCREPGRENLWYEEVVPHQSLFYLFVTCPDDTLELFDKILKENPIVQFGGHASIGYGVCKVQEV